MDKDLIGVAGFYIHLFEHPLLFVIVLSLVSIIIVLLFKRYCYSIFDPFVLLLVMISFMTADVFFMYVVGMIKAYFVLNYFVTEIAFVLGFYIFKPVSSFSPSQPAITDKGYFGESSYITWLFYISSLLYVTFQVVSYAFVGIPLFMEARLLAYKSGGGIGMIGRIIAVTMPVAFYLAIRLLSQKNQSISSRLVCYGVMLCIVVGGVLDGSKSTFYSLIVIIFFYVFINQNIGLNRETQYSNFSLKLRKLQFYLFVLAIIAALGVIAYEMMTKFDELITNPILQLAYRFIQSGDIFMYAYPDDTLSLMTWSNPLVAIFSDFLGMFRIVSWEQLPPYLGHELYVYFMGIDLPKGPNAVHNVFGLFYFGFLGSILFSFFLGFIISFTRNKLYSISRKNIIGSLLYMNLAIIVPMFYSDVLYGISRLDSLLIVFPVVVGVAVLANDFQYATRKRLYSIPRVSDGSY